MKTKRFPHALPSEQMGALFVVPQREFVPHSIQVPFDVSHTVADHEQWEPKLTR